MFTLYANRFFIAILALAGVLSGTSASAAERGRVRIQDNTVVTDEGTLLRGTTVWIFKYGKQQKITDYTIDPAYWDRMKAAGLNAVRVICWDPAQKQNGWIAADLGNQQDVDELLSQLDRVVELASERGMYVNINYHDPGNYDMAYLTTFWKIVAPRYAKRTHVLYEITNEPVAWFAHDYKPKHIADFTTIYKLVKEAAPDTHQILLSFANVYEWEPGVSMTTVAKQLTEVDWKNASVGFHPYATNGTSAAIVDLKKHFPVINTEQNLPRNEKCDPMDNEEWGQQTMERLKISWFTWQMEGYEKFEMNCEKRLLNDAKAKGYLWHPDRAQGGAKPTIEQPTAMQRGTNVTLLVKAADPDGEIRSVTFRDGQTDLGKATKGPDGWSLGLTGGGTRQISAIATDDMGNQVTSAPVTLIILGR